MMRRRGSGGGAAEAAEGTAITAPRRRDDDDDLLRNRPPRAGAPVRLQDVVGCQAIFISYAALLAGAEDLDGDPLTVLGIRASSGELVAG